MNDISNPGVIAPHKKKGWLLVVALIIILLIIGIASSMRPAIIVPAPTTSNDGTALVDPQVQTVDTLDANLDTQQFEGTAQTLQ